MIYILLVTYFIYIFNILGFYYVMLIKFYKEQTK